MARREQQRYREGSGWDSLGKYSFRTAAYRRIDYPSNIGPRLRSSHDPGEGREIGGCGVAGSNGPSHRGTRPRRRDRNRNRNGYHSRAQGRRRKRSAQATAASVSSMSFSFVSPSKVAPTRAVPNTRIACDQHRIVFGATRRWIAIGRILGDPVGGLSNRHPTRSVMSFARVEPGTVIELSGSNLACGSGYGATTGSEITYWGLTAWPRPASPRPRPAVPQSHYRRQRVPTWPAPAVTWCRSSS